MRLWDLSSFLKSFKNKIRSVWLFKIALRLAEALAKWFRMSFSFPDTLVSSLRRKVIRVHLCMSFGCWWIPTCRCQLGCWFYQYRFYGKDQDQCSDLGICQGRKRRGQQRIRWLDGITDSYSCPWWHHIHHGPNYELTLGDSEGQGSLACCSPWGRKVGHNLVTEQEPQQQRGHKAWRWIRSLGSFWEGKLKERDRVVRLDGRRTAWTPERLFTRWHPGRRQTRGSGCPEHREDKAFRNAGWGSVVWNGSAWSWKYTEWQHLLPG